MVRRGDAVGKPKVIGEDLTGAPASRMIEPFEDIRAAGGKAGECASSTPSL